MASRRGHPLLASAKCDSFARWNVREGHARRSKMSRLFISYRRSDTQMVAGRLRESLAKRVGERTIFRDKNSIVPGEDWTKAIEQGLSGGVIVLALADGASKTIFIGRPPPSLRTTAPCRWPSGGRGTPGSRRR